jgi:predicted MFS family arabinose efflux permease
LTIVGLCNMVGTYACGVLGERYPKKSVLSVIYLLRAMIFLAFLVFRSPRLPYSFSLPPSASCGSARCR